MITIEQIRQYGALCYRRSQLENNDQPTREIHDEIARAEAELTTQIESKEQHMTIRVFVDGGEVSKVEGIPEGQAVVIEREGREYTWLGPPTVEQVANGALEQLWEYVALQYGGMRELTGDAGEAATAALHVAAERAIRSWLRSAE